MYWTDAADGKISRANLDGSGLEDLVTGLADPFGIVLGPGPSVEDPAEAIEALIGAVISLNLKRGITNSLDTKLGAALNALDDVNTNNDVAAINTLEAFMNAVVAQSGDKIPEADADGLIEAAVNIIIMLAGP